MTATEVAARLNIDVNTFYRRRPRLETEHGFPARVPGIAPRWRPEAIERWLDRVETESCSPGLVVERQAAAANDAHADAIAEAQMEMDRRAAGMMRRVG